MALPNQQQPDPYEVIRNSNTDAAQAVDRLARVTQRAFSEFWHGDTAHRIAYAEGLNDFAAKLGTTSAATFNEHLATVMICIDRLPSTAPIFESPPIDMATVYDESGMIDIALFSAALDAATTAQ